MPSHPESRPSKPCLYVLQLNLSLWTCLSDTVSSQLRTVQLVPKGVRHTIHYLFQELTLFSHPIEFQK